MAACRAFTLALALLAVLLSATNCEVNCPTPESSTGTVSAFGTEECLYVDHLPHNYQRKDAETKYEFAIDQCNLLKIGELHWRLPKVDTGPKNKDLYRAMIQHPKSDVHSSFVWIGLRRYGPRTTDKAEWADSKYWRWTVDNVSMLEMKGRGIEFWKDDQPDNSVAENTGDLGLSEECVWGSANVEDLKFQFYSTLCLKPSQDAIYEAKTVRAYVCTATPDVSVQWWFYLLCVIFVLVSIAALSGAGFLLYRIINKKGYGRYDKKKRTVRQRSDEKDIYQKPQRDLKKRKFGRWYQHPRPPITKSVSIIPIDPTAKSARSPFPVEALKSKTPTSSGTASSMPSIKAPQLFSRMSDEDTATAEYSNVQPTSRLAKKVPTKPIATKSPTAKTAKSPSASVMGKGSKTSAMMKKESKSPSASIISKRPTTSLMGKEIAKTSTRHNR